jgi:hypothetical protein
MLNGPQFWRTFVTWNRKCVPKSAPNEIGFTREWRNWGIWRTGQKEKSGGGTLIDNGVHMIDMV